MIYEEGKGFGALGRVRERCRDGGRSGVRGEVEDSGVGDYIVHFGQRGGFTVL